jgi:hypothetical protein
MATTFMRQASLRLAMPGLVLGLFVLGPVPAHAGRHTVFVPPPNGTDDTATLQAALDEGVARGPRCTVQLAAGTYRTRQVVVYNFDGTFRGVSRDKTAIEALPNFHVDAPPDDPLPATKPPNHTDSLWPDVLAFVDGDVTVSDVKFDVPSVPATQLWGFWGLEFHELASALRVQMTTKPMNVVITRIAVEGRQDPNAVYGYNMINCILIAGEQPRPDVNGEWRHDHYPFTGNVTIVDNHFRSCGGSDFVAHQEGSHITVARNTSEDVGVGVELANVDDSVVDITGNHTSATMYGVLLYSPYYPAEKSSRFIIRDNQVQVSGPLASDGIGLLDNTGEGQAKTLDVVSVNNTVMAQGVTGGGIHAVGTRGTKAWGNRITGSGRAGILVEGGTGCAFLWNALEGFTPAADSARILLDAGTSHCLVAGQYDENDVLNFGQDNQLLLLGRR